MEQLEKFFEDLFTKKIPYQLPTSAKEALVKAAPWITLIILVLSLPAILGILGLGSMMAGLGAAYGVRFGSWYYFGTLLLAVELVLMGLAIPGLLNRQIKGWRYVYYADLLSAVYGVLSSVGVTGLLWSLLASAIGLYVIFQVKSYYK